MEQHTVTNHLLDIEDAMLRVGELVQAACSCNAEDLKENLEELAKFVKEDSRWRRAWDSYRELRKAFKQEPG